ncbi:methionine-R-sulfoxide reductase B3, mitochondrial [Trichonephila clavipes]|nr:methionine-R-sulfoxide reductase B3, mitochondrial [Trichonephila clavipes]
MKHMITNSAHMIHVKLELSTWQVLLNVGDAIICKVPTIVLVVSLMNLIRLQALNGLVINGASQSHLKNFKYCYYPAVKFYYKPVPISKTEKLIHIPFYNIKRTFKIMECCGNSCGLDLSKEALKKKLTSMQYQVTQEGETERAFTGKYYKHFEKGTYTCIVCSQPLFSSDAKFDSKCGWPAFSDVIDSKNVKYKADLSHNMKRTEVSCSSCGAHLGHVFDDGPKPTGKRFCINSAALDFKKSEDSSTSDSSSKS